MMPRRSLANSFDYYYVTSAQDFFRSPVKF